MKLSAVSKSLPLLTTVSLAWFLVADVHAQGVTVGAGSVVSLGNATVQLNCNDLTIRGGGTVNAQGAFLETSRHLTIQSAGILNGGSSTIQLCGTWTNDGTFIRGDSTVAFYSDCGVPNDVRGSSDSDGDGIPDGLDPHFLISELRVPVLDQWGVLLIGALFVVVGKLGLRRRAFT